MITSLILTIVAFLVFWILIQYVAPPISEPMLQWGFRAIAALILILALCKVWGLGV